MATDIFRIDLVDEDVFDVDVVSDDVLEINMYSEDVFSIELINDSGSGPNDYNPLINKPSINDIELVGNKTFEQLGREDIANRSIKQIIDDQYDLIFGGNH